MQKPRSCWLQGHSSSRIISHRVPPDLLHSLKGLQWQGQARHWVLLLEPAGTRPSPQAGVVELVDVNSKLLWPSVTMKELKSMPQRNEVYT